MIITAKEAAKLITDGCTVGVAGMGLSGWCEEIAREIAALYKETGHPRDLTMRQGSAMGDWRERGMTVLGIEGLITRWSAAHIGSAFAMNELVRLNKMQCHCLPQGVIVNLWREIAAGRPGLFTKVGLGTFVDPRVEGGRMNECTTDELVEVTEINGEEYLFYKSFPLHVALVRGTVADEKGNISFVNESVINEGLALAQAAKNSGGVVIAQVEYLAKADSLNPKDVKIPGILVDHIVVATTKDACWQAEGVYYEPAFSGQIKKPLQSLPPVPFGERKIIARRCAMELKRGNTVNLGVGISSDVANIVSEEGYVDAITLTTESGSVGGVPASLPNFGSSYNAECNLEHGSMFDFIDGGGLDITILGMGEADQFGNVNVSKLGLKLTGPGGFINITRSTKRIVFCGTLTGKGGMKKMVGNVQQITFSGRHTAPEQEILYVTERCVFKLIDGVMTLTEIAPGLDVEKDIISQMDFTPRISPELKTMDASIFDEVWGKLGEYID